MKQYKYAIRFKKDLIPTGRSEEDMQRDIAQRMIAEMPLEEMNRLFNFRKFDPQAKEPDFKSHREAKNYQDRIAILKVMGYVDLEATLIIPDND